jgi:hypothetical protein
MNVTNEGLFRLHGKPSNYNGLEITNDEQGISNSERVVRIPSNFEIRNSLFEILRFRKRNMFQDLYRGARGGPRM